jgi:hypothetical protein
MHFSPSDNGGRPGEKQRLAWPPNLADECGGSCALCLGFEVELPLVRQESLCEFVALDRKLRVALSVRGNPRL